MDMRFPFIASLVLACCAASAPAVDVTSISATSTTYGAGDGVVISLAFNGLVTTVANTTKLQVAVGRPGNDAYAYATSSQAGVTSIDLLYQVVTGDNSADLDYSSTAALTGLVDVTPSPLLTAPGGIGSLAIVSDVKVDTTLRTELTTTLTPPDGDQKTAPLAYAITFSESVTGFTSGDLAVTNGTMAMSGSGASYSASVVPRSTLRVRQAAASGASLVSLSTASGDQMLTAGMPVLINNQLVTISTTTTVLTTPTPVGLSVPLAGAAAVGNDVWLPRGVNVTVDIAAQAASDLAGNPSGALVTSAVIYDPTPPVAIVTAPTSGISPQTYTIGFSEKVVGLFASGLTVTNGTAGTPTSADDGLTWTVPVTTNDRLTATSVAVKSGGVLDLAGNPCPASPAGTYQLLAVDGVTATPRSTTIGTGQTVTITVNLNHAVAFTPGSGPTLLLETGTTDRLATCTTAAGTVDTLEFMYVTASGDTAAALDYASINALDLNGGSLDGLTAISLPATGSTDSLAASALRVNTTKLAATITPDSPAMKAGPLTYNVTFTPAISSSGSLVPGDFAITGGTGLAVVVDAGLTSARISVNPATVTGTFDVAIRLKADTVTDALSNPNGASNEAKITYDTDAPTTVLTGPSGSHNSGPLAYTVTFSESVTGFTFADANLTNATSALSGSGSSYLLTATPRSTLSLVTGALAGTTTLSVQSPSRNQLLAAGTALWINNQFVVVSAPVTVLSSATTVSLANPLTVGASTGTDAWLPTGVRVQTNIPVAVASDPAGNPSGASGILTVDYDPTPPGAVVTAPLSGVSPQNYTITFSEAVTSLPTTALNVTGGIAQTPVTTDNIVWTVPVTVANRATTTALAVKAGGTRDLAGNACLTSPTASYAPLAVTRVTASPANTTIGKTNSVSITVHLNHEVQFTPGSSAATLELETGTTDRLATCTTTAGLRDALTFTYTVVDGDFSAPLNYKDASSLLLKGGTLDGLGTLTLPPTASASSLAQSALEIRATSFSATLNGPVESALSPLSYTVTFSSAINQSSLIASDFVVTGGTISLVDVDPGFTFATITVIPATTTGPLPVKFRLLAGTVTDTLTNTNSLSNELTTTYDPSAPVLTFSGLAQTMTAPAVVTVEATKAVTGLTSEKFVVENGSHLLTAVSASSYRLSISPTTSLILNTATVAGDTDVSLHTTTGSVVLAAGEVLRIGANTVQASATTATTIGTTPVTVLLRNPVTVATAAGVSVWLTTGTRVTVDAAAGACQDEAGNLSLNPAPFSFAYDPTPPLFSIATPTFSGTTATFTLTPSEPVQALDLADLTLTGANAISVIGSGGTAPFHTRWTVRVTPTVIDMMSLAVKGNAAFDAAGNASLPTTAATFPVASRVTLVDAQNADGTYDAGTRLRIRVTFTEEVTVTGVPTLALAMEGGSRFATYASGSGTTVLLFDYTVAEGDVAIDLDYTGTTALALSGGTLADADNHPVVLTLPAPGASGSLGDSSNLVIAAGDPTGPAKPDAGDLPDDSSSGCGAGSGIAILLCLGWLTAAGFRRRNRH